MLPEAGRERVQVDGIAPPFKRRAESPVLLAGRFHSKVAEVLAQGLEQAVESTRHVGNPRQENPGVEVIDGVRSIGIGDIFVDPKGQAHGVEGMGFRVVRSGFEREVDEVARRGPHRDMGMEPER
jgi:hypothetical protein